MQSVGDVGGGKWGGGGEGGTKRVEKGQATAMLKHELYLRVNLWWCHLRFVFLSSPCVIYFPKEEFTSSITRGPLC